MRVIINTAIYCFNPRQRKIRERFDRVVYCDINKTIQDKQKQECIPVGCVPAAHWPYAAVFFPGGVCLVLGGSPCQGGLPGPGGWGVFSLPGGPARRPPSPPVNRITDTCKNITLATTSLRPVIILSERKYLESNAHLIETKTNRQQTQNKIFLCVWFLISLAEHHTVI